MDIRNFFGPKKAVAGGGAAIAASTKADKKAAKTDDSSRNSHKKSTDSEKTSKKRRMVIDSDSDENDDFFLADKKPSPPKSSQSSKDDKKKESKDKESPGKTKLSSVSPSDFFASSGKSPMLSEKSPKNSQSEKSSKPSEKSTDHKKRKAEEEVSSKFSEDISSPNKRQKSDKRDSSTSLASKLAKKAKSHDSDASDKNKQEKEIKHKSPQKKKSRSKSRSRSPTKSKTPDKPAKTSTEDKPKAKKADKTPTKGLADESFSELAATPQEAMEEKKKHRQVAYQKFLTRGGASNPGCKDIPEGSTDCFAGLTFVLTGVYESLERDEMGEIIKKYGGKVTTSVSKNTSFLVVGSEAGASKTDKANKIGTKFLTEDEFLQLITQKSDNKKLLKEKENKTPSPEKREDKAKKIKAEPQTHEKKVKDEPKSPEKKVKDEPKSHEKKVKDEPKSPLSSKTDSTKIRIPKIPKIEPMETATSGGSGASTGSGSGVGESTGTGEMQLWVEKYKPTTLKAIIGQQGDRSGMNKLKIWLKDWNDNHLHRHGKAAPKPAPWGAAQDNGAWAKCALLSGPPGVGKTTTAYLVSKELGFDIVEMNASDTRSKKLLEQNVTTILNSTSVSSLLHHDNKVTSKRVLLMDEVDGMAGNEDRGGIAELIALLKTTKVPVIAMCNDRNHQKIRSLANHCFDLRFQRPRPEQIKAAMMSICFKEKIKIKPEALNEVIVGCGQDVRQVLHHLSMIKAGETGVKLEAADAKKQAEMAKKTSIKLGPWDVCKKVFSSDEHKTMSLFDKSDLYFYDYNMAGLFVQENYLSCTPQASKGDRKKTMELISKAADSLATGDIVERGVRSGMNWSLLPTAAVFCSVLPGEYMSGHLHGQIQFPAWLGKNSRRNKIDRILQELQQHTRLSAGASKQSLNLDYTQYLRDLIVRPLVKEGAEGVDDAVQAMENYSLLREDLDGLIEVTQWPDKPDPFRHVDSKTKAAFTRKYNKESVMLPYSTVVAVKKKAKEAVEGFDDEDENDGEEEEDNDNVEKDAMIKVKKATKPKKESASASSGTAAKGKGAGKGASKAKGKGKK